MRNQSITIPPEELFSRSEAYFLKMCGFHREYGEYSEKIEEAMAIRERYKEQFHFHCILSSYSPEIICKDEICWENEKISCKVLNKISREDMMEVFFYGMCLEDIAKKEDMDLLEAFYLDTWMTAMLDGARDWLKAVLSEKGKENQKIFLTEAFGPGFYGIGIEEVPVFLRIVNGEQIGMHWKRGAMAPAKSNVGMYLALSKETDFSYRDCVNCLSSGTTCEFCKNYSPAKNKKK